MSFTIKRRILNIIAVVFVVAVLIFYDFFTKTVGGVVFLVLFCLAYFILTLKWWRCPHCDSYLWRLAPFAAHCPYCGNELE